MTDTRTGRFPIYQAADRVKTVLLDHGFAFLDEGDGDEVEKATASYATFAEPFPINDENLLKLRDGQTVLRPRVLPAHLGRGVTAPCKLAGFGRVYSRDELRPMRHVLELLIAGEDAETQTQEIFSAIAQVLYNEPDLRENDAFFGPVSEILRNKTAIGEAPAIVAVLDVEQIAMNLFGLPSIVDLYCNDVETLRQYADPADAVGEPWACKAIDILRDMGYQETMSEVLYPKDIYKKMNMIQESWDKNNSGYPLVKKLGDKTALRTVLTPSTEQILADNDKAGNTDVRTFEVSHIYLPRENKILPKEHIAISMGAYGPGVNIDTFREDVTAFLEAMGIHGSYYVGSGMATAYKWNECYVVMDKNNRYLSANCGQISRKAQDNFGIGHTAFMANFELDALRDAAEGRTKSMKDRMKDEIDRD